MLPKADIAPDWPGLLDEEEDDEDGVGD